MSSVQTFIQRCLLNLENANANPAVNVAPSAIDSDWWDWMKRYRVWQANREIFLFPENWMVPELRLDKSDLFQTLEGTLLQGDVTADLVDDALLTYLKGLDVRARLDVIATYLDQNLTTPELSTLHVLGRTYAQPHKYFYRTFSTGAWSAWQAVNLDIQGDHMVLVVWRGRLNVFWVVFISQALPPQPSSGANPGPVSDLHFGDLVGDIFNAAAEPQVKVQLHWSEYLQGKWTNPISTDVSHYQALIVPQNFDPRNVPIHVSKEVDASQNEGAVKIHLDFAYPDDGVSFRVTSKNCDPDFAEQYWEPAPGMVYDAPGVDATFYTGSGSLSASFQTNISSGGSTNTPDTEQILQTVNSFSLLPCGNPVVPPFLDPSSEPLYQDAGALVSPFFYKDTADASTSNELTFFVQPSLTEQTIVEWDGWAIQPSTPTLDWTNPAVFNQINVIAQVPVAGPVPVNPGDPVFSVYPMQNAVDWVTNPATAISYGGVAIGKSGGINLHAGSSPGSGVLRGGGAIGAAGIASGLSSAGTTARTLTIVGTRGLSLSQLRSIKANQGTTAIANIATLSGQRKS
jgi:hypothetical protein